MSMPKNWLDSVNPFVNSQVDEVVYCEFPDGYQIPGYCLLLGRALYGLKSSSVLWQEEFSKTLSSLKMVRLEILYCLQHTPCAY